MRGAWVVETGRVSEKNDILVQFCLKSERDGSRVGVLCCATLGTPLQEGLPFQTGVPAPIIIITLQGEPGAASLIQAKQLYREFTHNPQS
ncbi:unnamed protein product, partial [Brenthis ino]